tara:strand:+ start:56584 stop:56784 length:201 start_codon:yes stop_codon:yes gene_type:complete
MVVESSGAATQELSLRRQTAPHQSAPTQGTKVTLVGCLLQERSFPAPAVVYPTGRCSQKERFVPSV